MGWKKIAIRLFSQIVQPYLYPILTLLHKMSHLCSTPCNSTSTSAPVKLGLRLLAGAPPVFAFRFESQVAFTLPVDACPYKERPWHLCMQIQVYEKYAFNLRISGQLRTLWRFKNTFPRIHVHKKQQMLSKQQEKMRV